MSNPYLELLDQVSPATFARDPRPGWAGPGTLFGCRAVDLSEVPAGCQYVAAGIPFDGTASSRPGASEGPRAIRQASLVFSSYLDSLGEHEMLDTRTGSVFRYAKANVVDAGDLHVYPTDTRRNFQAVATEVELLARSGATPVLLGGDHSIGFATFVGVQRALSARQPQSRLGLIQIDHHFDFGANSTIHGPLYHGSNARRISELPSMQPDRMAFVGAGSITRKGQFDGLLKAGSHIVPAREMRARGVAAALEPVVAAFRRNCTAVHLSIDIDVLDCSVAPGTGNVTIGGLSGGELMDAVEVIRQLPLAGIEIVEVSPRYDPTGRTPQIAAQLLFELLFREYRKPEASAIP
ncbi:agmatinase [Cystobacter fuscus]|uniref:Agmatinase n=1 Tax=Cystobacter fuscus TaxID=43 RepID=A0A250IVX4_9BACT|nr:agmatinase family protein [Cystobacter fuscus]ATB35879.1 agmatinase [Cystobacter fuscus]